MAELQPFSRADAIVVACESVPVLSTTEARAQILKPANSGLK